MGHVSLIICSLHIDRTGVISQDDGMYLVSVFFKNGSTDIGCLEYNLNIIKTHPSIYTSMYEFIQDIDIHGKAIFDFGLHRYRYKFKAESQPTGILDFSILISDKQTKCSHINTVEDDMARALWYELVNHQGFVN
jgi:hypothetical protein